MKIGIKRKHILLLNPPADKKYLRDCYCTSLSKADYYWHPLDLLIQSGILAVNHEVSVIDAVALELSKEETLRRIVVLKPEAILVLLGSISWDEDIEFLESVHRKNPSIYLIGSGELLRFDGVRQMRRHPFLNAVLLDFTSDAVNRLLDPEGDGSLPVKDCLKRYGEEILEVGIEEKTIFSFPIPEHGKFPMERYRLPFGPGKKFASILSSYGCPYHCRFCNVGSLGFKIREIDNFMKELKLIYSLGFRKIYIRDATFAADRRKTEELLNEIIRSGMKIYWNCFSRIDLMSWELLKLMRRAGCYMIQFGIETSSERLQEEYQKNLKLETMVRVFGWCREIGIATGAHYILGLPGDDRTGMKKTFTFVKSLDPSYIAISLAEPRFGASFRGEFIKEEMEADGNLSPSLSVSREELHSLQNSMMRRFYFRPGYIFKQLSAIRTSGEFLSLCKNAILMVKGTLNINN